MVASLRDDGRGILALRVQEGLIHGCAVHPSGVLASARTCKALRGGVEQDSNPRLPTIKKTNRAPEGPVCFLAGGEGFEPPLTESESVVLPLDDPPRQGTSISALC